MRVYFIFEVKDEFLKLYKDRPSSLYRILKSIYKLSFDEVEYGYTLLKQITNTIDKQVLDRDLFVKLHREYPYSKRDGVHYFNQLYKDEVSRLSIKKSYMKLEVDGKDSSFFDILSHFSNNLFVCDFKRGDFFYINGCK